MTLQAFDRSGRADFRVELVRQAWESVGNGDYGRLSDLLANDVVWVIPSMPNVPFAGTWRGRDQVQKFFRLVEATQEVIEFTPCEVIAQGDQVVVLGNFANRVKATGKISRSQWAQVWTIRDGQIASMLEFVDTNAVSSAFRPKGDGSFISGAK